MNQNDLGRLTLIVDFTVRNDKWRGIVIEKFATKENEYFFKYQDQKINNHCEQIQKIVRQADVKRTKKISVDISTFSYEYYKNKVATFKGCTLSSVNSQITKICEMFVNKEVGSIKRNITVTQNKQQKIEEHNRSISSRMESADEYYKELRAFRLRQLFGDGDRPTAPQGPSSGSGSSQNPQQIPSQQPATELQNPISSQDINIPPAVMISQSPQGSVIYRETAIVPQNPLPLQDVNIPRMILQCESQQVPPRIQVAAVSPQIRIPQLIEEQEMDDILDYPIVDEYGIPIDDYPVAFALDDTMDHELSDPTQEIEEAMQQEFENNPDF